MHDNVVKFVIWICKRFDRKKVQAILDKLLEILNDPNSEIQPKNTFKEDHPNYQKFNVDPEPPLKEKPGGENQKILERTADEKQLHRPSAGFNTLDGAITLTTLFVTHYNFLKTSYGIEI